MPLNKLGKKLHEQFRKEYGKIKGDRIFYSWEHKHPELKKKR